MPLRLAYATLFLLALVAFLMLWSQVGGQSHLDLMPWHLKLLLSLGAAYAFVRAVAAACSQEQVWTGSTLTWAGIMAVLLLGCGLATYYYHLNEDVEEEQDEETVTSAPIGRRVRWADAGLGDARSRD
jgi:hypothetical protein